MSLKQFYKIIEETEKRILDECDLEVKLSAEFVNNDPKGWEELLVVVSDALNIDAAYFTRTTRYQSAAFMRHITAKLIRDYHPSVPYSEIARVFNRSDHSTIVNNIRKCNDLLDAKDEEFTAMYEKAAEAVSQWVLLVNNKKKAC